MGLLRGRECCVVVGCPPVGFVGCPPVGCPPVGFVGCPPVWGWLYAPVGPLDPSASLGWLSRLWACLFSQLFVLFAGQPAILQDGLFSQLFVLVAFAGQLVFVQYCVVRWLCCLLASANLLPVSASFGRRFS